jgi:hypothetical protein
MKVKIIKAMEHGVEAIVQKWLDDHKINEIRSVSTACEQGFLIVTIIYSE